MNQPLSKRLLEMASQAGGETNQVHEAQQRWIWYWLFSRSDPDTYQQELADIETSITPFYTAQQLLELSWKAAVLESLSQQTKMT